MTTLCHLKTFWPKAQSARNTSPMLQYVATSILLLAVLCAGIQADTCPGTLIVRAQNMSLQAVSVSDAGQISAPSILTLPHCEGPMAVDGNKFICINVTAKEIYRHHISSLQIGAPAPLPLISNYTTVEEFTSEGTTLQYLALF